MGESVENRWAARPTPMAWAAAASPRHGLLGWVCATAGLAALLTVTAEAQPPAQRATPPAGSAQAERRSPSEQGVEAYLSEDALQVLYVRPVDMGEFGRNAARAGFFINEQRDLIGLIDVLVDVGEQQRRPHWTLQVGPRAYGALMADEDQDVFALAFGGRLSYFLGRDRQTSVSIDAFYAPDIVTFGNADNVKDTSIRFETALTARTRIFVGYRVFEFDLTEDREVDDNLHIGVRYQF